MSMGLSASAAFKQAARFWLVKVEVSVTVANGAVTDIEILKHDNGLGRKAEVIRTDVINAQSLNVFISVCRQMVYAPVYLKGSHADRASLRRL